MRPADLHPHPPRHPRGPELRGCLTLSVAARVKDISLSGVAVECTHHLQPRRQYHFRIGVGEESTELAGQVVWCFLKESHPGAAGTPQHTYRAGLELDGMLSDRARELLRFLEANALLTLETRLCGRFPLRTDQTVHLNAEIDFQARSLSTTGMLIETEAIAEPGTAVTVDLQWGDEPPLRLEARVAYVRRLEEGETERSELGLEFAPLSEDLHARVAALVARGEPGHLTA